MDGEQLTAEDRPALIVVETPRSAQERDRTNDPSVELDESAESVVEPAKVLRIATMIRQLLEEVRRADLDDAGRARLRQIFEQSLQDLKSTLSPELEKELETLSRPFDAASPTDAELRVAHAQLVGWLEGLLHGIQAALFAQQVEAQLQLEQMRQRSLPSGRAGRGGEDQPSTGSYL